MVNEELFAFLLEHVEETKRLHHEAKQKFWAVAGKPREAPPRLPTGLPHPDGSELVRRAVAEETFTMKAHIEAMMRLNRYLLDGTIPPNVPEKFRKAKSASGANAPGSTGDEPAS
jgi:hypothetical protein